MIETGLNLHTEESALSGFLGKLKVRKYFRQRLGRVRDRIRQGSKIKTGWRADKRLTIGLGIGYNLRKRFDLQQSKLIQFRFKIYQ